MTKHIIWSSHINISDWLGDKESILEDRLDGCSDCSKNKKCESCDRFYTEVSDINDSYLDDEKLNLNIRLDNNVIAFAKLGLWDGTKSAYKILGNNVNCIFDISEEGNTYYVDAYNVRATCVHHDGRNQILYRMLKPNVDIRAFEAIMYKNGYNLSSQQISRYTTSLRPYVAQVYGW